MLDGMLRSPGDIVRIRGECWRVIHCHRHDACVVLDVEAAAEHHRRTSFILPFEQCDYLPAIDRPRRVRPAQWRRVVRRTLADALPEWWSLRTAARAELTVLPFQLEAAVAITRRKATRVLIADAVGLGKTIQAGLVIAEIIERTSSPHVLVVCPASLRAQWADELTARFRLSPCLLDAAGLAATAAALPSGSNPWRSAPLVVTSIDFVKRPEVIRAVEPVLWDLIVLDEAHSLAGRSDRATAASALACRARALVMLTATPHSGDDDAFQRLTSLGALPGDPPLLVLKRDRAEIPAPARRRTPVLRVTPTGAEQRMHDALENYTARATEEGGLLALQVLFRRAVSSAASLARSVERRLLLLMTDLTHVRDQLTLPFREQDDDESPDAELRAAALSDRPLEVQLLHNLLDLASAAAQRESKLVALRRLLERVQEPAIVFTQYRDTLATAAAALPFPAVQLHGGMTLAERRLSERSFTHGGSRLLLATDAASEGLNLHHRCRLVINLDAPWTPVRLEQRVGRVDRIGQSRRVHAVMLTAAGTREEADVARLRHRSAMAEQALPAIGFCSPETVAESRRIVTARALEPGAAAFASDRAVVTVHRRGRRSSRLAVACYSIRLADGAGNHLLELVCGVVALQSHNPEDASVHVSRWFVHRHPRLASELRAAAEIAITRERSVTAALQQTSARLSRTLLQPGLFDKRAERTRHAQAIVVDDALRTSEERLNHLLASREVRAGAPALVFVGYGSL